MLFAASAESATTNHFRRFSHVPPSSAGDEATQPYVSISHGTDKTALAYSAWRCRNLRNRPTASLARSTKFIVASNVKDKSREQDMAGERTPD
eukprot:6118962-Pleurochrysis_carterae.AAC.1